MAEWRTKFPPDPQGCDKAGWQEAVLPSNPLPRPPPWCLGREQMALLPPAAATRQNEVAQRGDSEPII